MTGDDFETDDVFAMRCGFVPGSNEASLAVALRREFAAYDQRRVESIVADAKVIETGVFHPTDSLDLLDFSLMLEGTTGIAFKPDAVLAHLSPEPEELTVGEWVRRMVAMTQDASARQDGGVEGTE